MLVDRKVSSLSMLFVRVTWTVCGRIEHFDCWPEYLII